MASPWDAFPEVGAQPQGGGVILSDPYQARGDQRAEEDQGMQREKLQVDVGNTGFNQRDKLRSDYNALPAVKEYRVAIQALAASLKRGSDGSGDTALIYDYVKALDPTSVVREAEVGMAASGASTVEAAAAKLKKEFGIDGGGNLPPEVRNRLRREIITSTIPRVKQYNQMRGQFEELAKRNNFDPYEIVGNHDADPYVDTFREYDQRNGLGEFAKGQDRGAAIPGATMDNIAFDMDTGKGAFGSQIETPRLNPQQQAALDAFLKANAGNPNFGPEQLTAFYQSVGIQGGAMPGDDKFYEAVRKGEAFGTQPNYEQSDEARRLWAEEQVRQQLGGEAIGSRVSLDNGILPWTDELMGVRDGVTNLLTGDGTFGEGYRDGRDIERAAVRMSDAEHGMAPKIVGSLLTPAGLVSKTNLARDALAVGAMYGAGAGEGLADTVSKTATGGAFGYAAGKGLEKAAPYIANAVTPTIEKVKDAFTRPGQREFVDAAERQSLEYMAADIPNATGSRMATSLSKMTLGGIPIADRARKIVDAASEAKDKIARSLAPKGDVQGAGQATKRGLSEWEAGAKSKSSQLHEAIPIARDRQAVTASTTNALADINAGLSSNRALSEEIVDPTMLRYQQALESGGLSWADMKRFRTYIGEQVDKPSVEQKMSKAGLRKLYAGLSEDMRATAQAEGPQALKAFERANDYTRGMEQRREEVLTSVLGKKYDKGDEAAFKQIQSWSNKDSGDWAKLSRTMRSLPEEEANIVRAEVIDRLGMVRKGAQDANGEAFSPAEFMTQWNGMDKRAKSILFQGPQRKALEDLAIYFDGLKSASQQFANTSKTGLVNSALATAGTFGVDAVTGALAGIAQLGAGKFLASPKFASWMTALIKKPNPAAVLQHVERLSSVARSQPVIANDIFTLQQRLAESFAQPSALRSAAEEDNKLGNPPPAQGERGNAQ